VVLRRDTDASTTTLVLPRRGGGGGGGFGCVRRRRRGSTTVKSSLMKGEIPMIASKNKTVCARKGGESVDVLYDDDDDDDFASLRPPAKNTNNNNNEAFQQLAILTTSSSSSSSLPKKRATLSTYDENVFDATAIVFSAVGFNLCFLLGLAVWVKGLKTRYENAIWKIKRLETEKRDLAVAHNMEKADLADQTTRAKGSPPSGGGEYFGSGYGRRGGAAAAVSTSASGGADDVMIQGLKAERDALKQALKTTQTQMQHYVRENAALEHRLETALLEVEKLTPS